MNINRPLPPLLPLPISQPPWPTPEPLPLPFPQLPWPTPQPLPLPIQQPPWPTLPPLPLPIPQLPWPTPQPLPLPIQQPPWPTPPPPLPTPPPPFPTPPPPLPTPPPPKKVESPLPQPPTTAQPAVSVKGSISVGVVAGVAVGGLVLVALVAALVVFLIRRRRRHADHQHGASPLPELPVLLTSTNIVEEGNIPREVLKLSPIQSPKIAQDLLHLPESQLHSITLSNSSSVSSGDKTQPSLAFVGVRRFTFQELSDATDHFNHINFLGQGGFGSVYKGIIGGDDVAIKQLQHGSFQGEREFMTEINVISRIHHKNLVSLVGYCMSGLERLLVYEYVDNNNLAFHLQASVTPVLDWATRLSLALGAAKGIAYLHEECHPRIIHRDIKSTNILLDSSFRPKVSDFGLAKFVPDDNTHVTTRIMGSFGYLAPEFGSSGRLTEKSDVFSFGIVLLELITARPPINLVEWASPYLDQALEDGDFETQLIDPKLGTSYDHGQMNAMVTCAAISVHRFPDHRPRMSQVVLVLQGNISPETLKAQTSRPRNHRRPI